jgi:integrase/recombinase XerD
MKIREAMEHYAQWFKERGSSKRAISVSLSFVGRFAEFAKQQGVEDMAAVTAEILEGYKAAVKKKKTVASNRPLRHTSIDAYLSSIRLFFQRAVANGWTSSDPSTGILRGIAPDRPIQNFLTEEEMANVLNRPDTALPIGLRDRLILELMYTIGLRKEEIIDLNMSDVKLEQNELHIKETLPGRERTLTLPSEARALLDRYLKEVRPVWDHPTKRGRRRWRDTALFYSPRHGPMSENILEKMVGGHVRAVRPSVPNCGQAIRYACAVRLLKSGADVAAVNVLLGQRKMNQTMAYTRLITEDHPKPR